MHFKFKLISDTDMGIDAINETLEMYATLGNNSKQL